MMTQAEYYRSIYDDTINYAKDERTMEIAKEMILESMPIEKIAKVTKLSIVNTVKRVRHTLQRLYLSRFTNLFEFFKQ